MCAVVCALIACGARRGGREYYSTGLSKDNNSALVGVTHKSRRALIVMLDQSVLTGAQKLNE